MELATNLACVALYDMVIFADDSGSMIFEEGGERVNDLKVILGRVAEVIAGFQADLRHTRNSMHVLLLSVRDGARQRLYSDVASYWVVLLKYDTAI